MTEQNETTIEEINKLKLQAEKLQLQYNIKILTHALKQEIKEE